MDFLFFCRFLADFRPKIAQKSRKWQNLGRKAAKNRQKNKKLKIGLCTSLDTHEIYPETNL